MATSVEGYLTDGCGRCELGGTPECKVHQWTEELMLLRKIVQDCGLTEKVKWGAPTYTLKGKNVLMIAAFRNYCCISFFKGVLLNDENGLLVQPGPNSQAVRLLKFTKVEQISEIEMEIRDLIRQAIENETSGRKIEFKSDPEPMPEELKEKLERDPVFRSAFEGLTPGRQRGYVLYISQAKQSGTRKSRIEKCAPLIMMGIGLHDRYKGKRG